MTKSLSVMSDTFWPGALATTSKTYIARSRCLTAYQRSPHNGIEQESPCAGRASTPKSVLVQYTLNSRRQVRQGHTTKKHYIRKSPTPNTRTLNTELSCCRCCWCYYYYSSSCCYCCASCSCSCSCSCCCCCYDDDDYDWE